MASSKKLQGITIEIDGNTTKLSDSLKDVNKTIATTQSELRNINSLLKLDPSNTTLLAQKQKVLADTIKGTSEKLSQLKEAKRQADERIASGVEDKNSASYRELEREIIATENSLSKLNDELKENASGMKTLSQNTKDAGNNALSFGDIVKANLLSSAIQAGIKGLASSMAKIGSALIDVGKQAIESYAEFEQLVGGVETLFGKSASVVQDYANNAYKTAGLSANEYMETVTSFSASLISGLNGDTAKAAKIADMAITDMSDNANKMGSDIESIQNAYQGFAKGQYNLLDNLKLGYGGTKTEMERLLKDAQKISGVKYDISNLSDVYEAIHVVQQEMGIAGTTAKESTKTISGSLNALKGNWKNVITAIGSGNDNVSEMIEGLTDSLMVFIENISPVILNVVEGLGEMLGSMAETLLPQLLDVGVKLILNIVNGIVKALPNVTNSIVNMVFMIINTIFQMLPQILNAGIQLVLQLVMGIVNNLPLIIDSGITLVVSLIEGIADALPQLIEAIPDIIVGIVNALTDPDMIMKLLKASGKIMVALGEGLIKAIPELLLSIPIIIARIVSDFADKIKNTNWKKLGKDILNGILNGMLDFGRVVKDTIKKVGDKITGEIKDFFGIKSPSRLMKKEVGKYLASGIAVGFEEEIPNTIRDVQASLSSLNSGIQASVNPVINPQANSNPLIIQIENFNNQRESDVQALAEELEFYRKRTSLATGGN